MQQPQGPSPEFLKRLHGMLPSFVKGLKEKKILGRGKPVGVLKARKCCPVCSTLFDKISTPQDVLLESKNCERCQGLFDEGYIALVCGDKFAFVRSASFEGIDLKIVKISPANMQKIEQEFKAQWETKKDADIQS